MSIFRDRAPVAGAGLEDGQREPYRARARSGSHALFERRPADARRRRSEGAEFPDASRRGGLRLGGSRDLFRRLCGLVLAAPCARGRGRLGYRLRRDAWERGFASEGARALVAKGFAEIGLERIVATAMTVHAPRGASWRGGADLCAYRLSGLARLLSRERTRGCRYEIARDEWEARLSRATDPGLVRPG